MIKADLHSGWTVRADGGTVPSTIGDDPLPATVPGTVHTDLLAAGLIPDPYLGANEAELAWSHRTAWLYETTLDAPPAAAGERVDLVFDGLDTVATIRLGDGEGGAEVGRTANMHRGYRFDVRDRLTGGPAPLSVRFDSALAYAERMQEILGPRPGAYDHPFNAVRKMACSFGWDWGPDLQTAGIWKPVRLERWRVARLAEVRPLATLEKDGTTGRLRVTATVERSGLEAAGPLRVRVEVAGHTAERDLPAGAVTADLAIEVPRAPVWWPIGYGDQPREEVRIELWSAGEMLDRVRTRVGFRSVALDETPDRNGHRFALVVNGRDVFVRGLNWIPEDHLLTRLTRDDYAAAVGRAVEANANFLRVWGGGVFESDDFYDVCDELGVLVWQDFPFACAAYAEEPPLRDEILAEARENVVRLGPHPSLAVWNGGNENIWGHEDWHWKEQLGDRTWGAGYYYTDFPALLAELDPSRPYHPGSPSSPGFDPELVHPNDERYGTRHEWEAWNREDYTWHDRFTPRFCAEFGWQAPPTWATLTEALDAADLAKDSAAFELHQKAQDGTAKLDRGLAHHMAVPDDFAAWHWATQLNQARATAYAIGHLRSHMPHTMGSVLWQLNDCWPVTSWAVVDGAGRRKPAWYALRRAYAPRLLTFRGDDVVAVNDSDQPWTGTVRLRRLTFDGTPVADRVLDLHAEPRAVAVLPVPAGLLGDSDREVLVAEVDDLRATRLFAEDRDLAYHPAPLEVSVARVPEGFEVTVTAESFARDVTVLADRVAPDAVADDQLVDLLPGESHTFTVRTAATADPGGFLAPEVVRSANALAVPVSGAVPAGES